MLAVTLAVHVVLAASSANSSASRSSASAGSGCDPTAKPGLISGKWKDPRHTAEWTLTESASRHGFTAHGPWPGSPVGQLYKNGSVSVVYSPTNTATGVFSDGPSCDFITW